MTMSTVLTTIKSRVDVVVGRGLLLLLLLFDDIW
jgi:hypothetical protein